jgi:hypothetical protein
VKPTVTEEDLARIEQLRLEERGPALESLEQWLRALLEDTEPA